MTDNTHGQVPEALPAIQRFEVVDCIDDKHVPAVIPKPHGPWVRYEDHIAALAAGQATAAQQPGAAGLIGALEDAQRAINSMKVEAETAAQGDERMMLEACETISNEGLQADMAIRAALASHGQAPAQAAPQREPVEMPAEIEQMATGRYKVVPSHESMFHRWAVVAGTGAQQLYLGREVECQNMARKFAGAFLDGAFAYHSMTAAPTAQPAPQQEAQKPFAWHVCSVNSDGSLSLEHAAAWEEAAHEHINDAITEHDIEGAGSWVVRPAYHAPQPSPTAQAADSVQEDAARYRWLREGNDAKHGAAWHVAVNLYGCEWDAAIDAAMNKGATP